MLLTGFNLSIAALLLVRVLCDQAHHVAFAADIFIVHKISLFVSVQVTYNLFPLFW